MNEYMQFSAKTKNEAITKACIELGVTSDQLDIQVISEGSSGFFGIGSKPAIIKARKVEDHSEEKELEGNRSFCQTGCIQGRAETGTEEIFAEAGTKGTCQNF